MTIIELIVAVRQATPSGVAVTTSPIEAMDGISFFFASQNGLASSTVFGVSDRLEAGDAQQIIDAAAAQAATIA